MLNSVSSGSSSPVQNVPQYEAPSNLPNAAQRAPVADGVARLLKAIGGNPAAPANPSERTLVASEDSVTAGGVRDAYDMKLYQEPDGTYTLELNMKVEFNFQEGPNGETWTQDEKEQFMKDYNAAIEQAWSGHTFTTDDGKEVKLDVNLDLVERPDGFFGGIRDALDPSENWSIDVVKIPPGDFHRSSVTPSLNRGNFDSEDVKPVSKGASDPQVGAAHEFGHMIGLPDEYVDSAPKNLQADKDSIMNAGMDVRERHLDILETWVENND